MIVAGVMSGTSADGIDVALVEISGPASRQRQQPRLELLGHAHTSYNNATRRMVLGMMNAPSAPVADLARLNFYLGELYAEAVAAAQKKFRLKAALIGCHGQTLYHQGEPASFLGRKVAVTWQTGEGAVIAARLGIPVVSDFRPADMAAGGKGAPLVPFLDYLLYRDARLGRIVQNIGGIANLTAIPAGALPNQTVAFDTGPGNMVIDAVMQQLFDKTYDRNGKVGASGKVLTPVLDELLKLAFFHRKPPKTAGREEFGREFVARFIKRCGRARKEEIVATATALTARSIAGAVQKFVLRPAGKFAELISSGGGTQNATLMKMLADELHPLGLKLRVTDELGLPSEAKEAAAFALLAYETWNRRTSNVPAATGANRPAVLGKISYA